jgi:YVTN family beta-propeller protein
MNSHTFFQNSISQKKIVAICFGLILLSIVPFADLVFAVPLETIPAGGILRSVTYVEPLKRMYVTSDVGGLIEVIDVDPLSPTYHTVVATIPIGISPIQAIYVEIGISKLIYVSDQGQHVVHIVDADPSSPTFDTVIGAPIPVGLAPFTFSFNSINNQLYVPNSFSNDVSVIDVDPSSPDFNTVITTIPAGTITIHTVVNHNTNMIYASNLFGNSVTVIDGATNNVVNQLPTLSPAGMFVDEVNNRVFISESFIGQISVFDGATNTFLQTIPTGGFPGSAILDSSTGRIYVPNINDATLTIIDQNTLNVIGTVPVEGGLSAFAISLIEATQLIYVPTGQGLIGTLNVYDLNGDFPPIADAGPDQKVNEGDFVQLDGSSSSDFNGDPLTYQWSQTKGSPVILSDSTIVNPTFSTAGIPKTELLEFQLIVNDGSSDSRPDFVNIVVIVPTVIPVNLQAVGNELIGSVTVENFPANNPIIFDLLNPAGTAIDATLEETELTSIIQGTDVDVDFTIIPDIPAALPQLTDPALFFEINVDGIDVSNPANLPPDNLPQSQFLVNKDYVTGQSFSDGCPVVPINFLNEVLNEWEQIGDPLLPNSNTFYVINTIDSSVIVVDGNTHEVITTIPVGLGPQDSAIDKTLNKLYTGNVGGSVSVIDMTTNSLLTTIPGIQAAGAPDIHQSSHKLYTGGFGTGLVTVIDTNTDTILTTIDTSVFGGSGLSLVRVNQALDRVYVTDLSINSVFVIDTNLDAVIDVVSLTGVSGDITINQKTNQVYISIFTGNSVDVIDGTIGSPTENTVIDTIPIGAGPIGLKVNELTNKLFASGSADGTVSVIDTTVNAVIETINIPAPLFGLNINKNTDRVYAINQLFGTMAVIDGSTFEVLDTVTIEPGIIQLVLNDLVPNPVRDPANDILDMVSNEILECAYIGDLPHLSKFAIGGIKALALGALVGGSGGSSGGSAPSLNSISYDGVTTTNEDGVIEFGGVIIDKISPINNLPTQTVETGVPFELRLPFYEDNGVGALQHVAVYFLQGDEKTIYDSQTSIIYEPNSPVQFSNSIGFISNVKAEGIAKSAHAVDVSFGMTFNFPTEEPVDVIVRSWDKFRRSSDIKFNDFLMVIESNSENQLPINTSNEVTSSWTKSAQSTAIKSTTIFNEEFDGTQITFDLQEGQSVTKNIKIPQWIKNNANWWSQGDIDDNDFVVGVQYLIEQNIVDVPKRHIVSILEDTPTSEIPNWVKSNASWWAEGLVSDQEFIQAIKWLINEGVMTV